MIDLEALKQQVCDDIDRRAGALIEASHQIHARPELGFQEHFAHDLLTAALADAGLETHRGAYDVPTGFLATAGVSDPSAPEVAIVLEYDALPEIGHACGHNIIATAGLGAALAAATVAPLVGGRLKVLGTPAEEGGGGKIVMADRGAFDGLAAALMVHPAAHDLTHMNCVAIQQMEVDFHGRAAHAAAAPQHGRNALDAAVLGYMNVAALRQHISPRERIHGIFTHGGDKPNIVPQFASQFWYIRSETMKSLQPLKERVLACMQAGATAAGCTCEHRWNEHPYSDMIDNAEILGAYAVNAARLGRVVHDPDGASAVVGSTDMGNVSYLAPSIHPMIKVAPTGTAIHTADFAVHARAESGDRGVIDGAKSLAMTAIDLWCTPALRDEAQRSHRTELAARS